MLQDIGQNFGMTAGQLILALILLYFIIKWAVKNGMKEAWTWREAQTKEQIDCRKEE